MLGKLIQYSIFKRSFILSFQGIQASCPPMVRVRLYGDTLSVKRKSQSDDAPPGVEPSASRVHEYKRLKSVG